MEKNKIVIIGAGWFGLPMAKHLHQQGHSVHGTTTTEAKLPTMAAEGITPQLLDLRKPMAKQSIDYLQEAATVIIAIPPSRTAEMAHTHDGQVEAILSQFSAKQRVFYISSTSVYPEKEGTYNESFEVTKENTGSPAIWQAEQHVLGHSDRAVVVRFGGLLGYDRIPGNYFAGKAAPGRNQPVNYIHRDDAVGLVSCIVAKGDLRGIFNGVSPLHPSRAEVYQKNGQIFGFPPPTSWRDEGIKRVIVPQRAVNEIDYTYYYPDPLHFFK